MDVMRFTVLDPHGTVSFVTHTSALMAFVAACSNDPRTLDEFLDAAEQYDLSVRNYVLNGLAIFDEYNLPEKHEAILNQISELSSEDIPVFRVFDDITQQASLDSAKAGVAIFNLNQRRIIHMQNSYDVERKGEVNFHNGKFLSIRMINYELPSTWSILP